MWYIHIIYMTCEASCTHTCISMHTVNLQYIYIFIYKYM